MAQYRDVDRFASHLRMLRERAGHSYRALAQRTDVGRSSLHRYCTGSSVPPDYGVVHRIAKACGASSPELRELHRLWALADTEREPADEEDEEREPADTAPPPETSVPDRPRRGAPWPTRRRHRVAVTAGACAAVLGTAIWGVASAGSPPERAAASDRRPLFSAACRPAVVPGQRDECVREVQRLVRRRGGDIDVNGVFDPRTLRRVSAFQALAGIPPNGIVTDTTKKALYDSAVRLDTWGPQRVRERVREVFPQAPDEAVAVAECQSLLDPLHVLPATDGTRNWGLFQISDARLRELGGTPRQALDPEWNIQAARRLWGQERGFDDWPPCERT